MPLNILAWNNKIGLWSYFVGLRAKEMINRDSWGYSYFIVRGEILGFLKDELLRKHFFFTVNDGHPLHDNLMPHRFHPRMARQRQNPVKERQCTRHKSNYELFNCNNFNIRYWSWNYRGCWHQTCPPIDPR